VPIDHWHEVIADPTIADAVLDRLVHNAHRLALKGDSMRKITAQNVNLDAAKKTRINSPCRQRDPGRLRRNRWPPSIGTPGRVQSESLAAIPGIRTQVVASQLSPARNASISPTNLPHAGSSESSAWLSLSSATNLALGIEAARRRPWSKGTRASRMQ
jgi:IstB-like ATP binding protein